MSVSNRGDFIFYKALACLFCQLFHSADVTSQLLDGRRINESFIVEMDRFGADFVTIIGTSSGLSQRIIYSNDTNRPFATCP